jgi:putative ATPase
LDQKNNELPLPEIVRPVNFDEVAGQDHIWGTNAPLRRMAEQDRLGSWIFWGPPGCGKTTLASVIGRSSQRKLVVLSAVSAGVKDLREAISASQDEVEAGCKAHLLFLDEIHRLSKNQQDVLLPALESGVIKFIGATTENPSFEVNAAVNSRSIIFRFQKVSEDALLVILRRALHRAPSACPRNDVAEDVLQAIARSSAGDARRALNLLEAVAVAAPADVSPVDMAALKSMGDTFALIYDKKGDQHYDTISAFIKCIRAGQPDAALHYLARMLDAGEDVLFIARRLVIAASEDVGNASPMGLVMAQTGFDAVHQIGMPEARIVLAQVTTFLASSQKSNRSYVAINKALEDVREFGALEIPMALRNAPTELMKSMGYGKGYAYAHDDPAGAAGMEYLPSQLKGRRYYIPSGNGHEKVLAGNLQGSQPSRD